MTKRGRMAQTFQCACVIYMGALAQASAAAPPTPKVIACLNACEQVQTACMQQPLQVPPAQRTIKDHNVIRACNEADVKCDHRCRAK
jgi:hypothetical protein